MDLPIGFRDGLDAEEAVVTAIPDRGGSAAAQAIAIDPAVDHDMRDMDAEGPKLARHALRDHAQAGLGGGKMRKPRLAADAGRSACEDDGAAAERHEPAGLMRDSIVGLFDRDPL